jgi:hypothetical protein
MKQQLLRATGLAKKTVASMQAAALRLDHAADGWRHRKDRCLLAYIMKRPLMQTLIVASFATTALNAGP